MSDHDPSGYDLYNPTEEHEMLRRMVREFVEREVELPQIDVSATQGALEEHPAVSEVVVIPRAPRPGQIRLVAYIVRDEAEEATVSELRRYVKAKLAADQVPASFQDVDEIPRDEEGEVRADQLHDPFADDDSFVAPRTPAEILVGEIWREVLGVEAVSVYDNFFDIGGHSLLSMRVVNKVAKKTTVRLNQAIMVLQTLEQIAGEVEKQGGAPTAEEPSSSGEPESAVTGDGLFRRLRKSVFKG